MTKSGWAWALVIDDDAEVRTYVSATLARIGIHAVQAASGAEGLAKLSERHYDVVLLDNDMPGMRGLEVLEQMKRNPHTWGVPVISITGNATLNFATELQRLGGVGLVPKPFGMLELLCAVLTALKRPAAKNVSLPGLLAEYADRRLDAPPTGS